MTNWPQHRPLWFGAGTAAPGVALSNSEIAENAEAGDLVGELSVTAGEGSYSFSLTSNPGGLFAIAGSPGDHLVVAAALDYETAATHNITVQATNGVDTPISREFTITVTDVAEAVIQLDNDDVLEFAAIGDLVGILSVTGDWPGPWTFSLTSNPGGLFAVDVDRLEVAAALDYETATSHAITVQASNGFHHPVTRPFTIHVIDQAEPVDSPEDSDSPGAGSGPGSIPGLMGFWLPVVGTMWQDVSGTTPADADGERVARWDASYGPIGPLLQSDNNTRPTFKSGDEIYLSFADGLPSSDGYHMQINDINLDDPYLYLAALVSASSSVINQNIACMGIDGSAPWGSTEGVLFGQRSGTADTDFKPAHNFQGVPTVTVSANGTAFIWESIWTPSGVTISVNGATGGGGFGTGSFAFDPEADTPGTHRFRLGAGGGVLNLPTEYWVGRIHGVCLVSGAGAPISTDHRALIRDTLLAAGGL